MTKTAKLTADVRFRAVDGQEFDLHPGVAVYVDTASMRARWARFPLITATVTAEQIAYSA